MASSYIFDPSQGETPETVKQKRQMADALAARIFGRTPQNLGEGIGSIGQALIAGMMARNANEAETAGRSGANDMFSKITGMIGGGAPIAAPAAAPAAAPSIPSEALSASPMQDTGAPLSGGFLPKQADAQADDKQKYAYDFYLKRGYSPVQAAGIVGGLRGETANLNTTQVHDGGIGFGISGWNGDRLVNLRAFAKENGLDPNSLDTQLAFVDKELHSSEGGAFERLQGAKTPAEAGNAMLAYFRPKDWNVPGAHGERGQYAARTFQQYAQQPIQLASNDPNFIPTLSGPAEVQSPAQALAFNGQSQNANPLASLPPTAPSASGFAPTNDQPHVTTLPVRSTQLPVAQAPTAPPSPAVAPSGPSTAQLMQAASNPFLTEGQRAVVGQMLKQRLEAENNARDPMKQLQMQKLQAEVGKLTGTSGLPSELGLNPQYGVDKNGNPVLIQIGKDGKAVQTKLPEGVSLSKEPIKLDAGDRFVLLDPITRQPVGSVAKNLAEAESQKAQGKAQGAAKASLPTDLLTAEQTVKDIDSLLSNEGLDSIVGPLDQFRSSVLLGEKGRDALARFNQLKGRAFLSAYATLKGGGQITEVEGVKAENAMARMDRAQSENDFKTALRDFRDAVSTGMQKLREKAGETAPAADGWQDIGGVKIRKKQ